MEGNESGSSKSWTKERREKLLLTRETKLFANVVFVGNVGQYLFPLSSQLGRREGKIDYKNGARPEHRQLCSIVLQDCVSKE